MESEGVNTQKTRENGLVFYDDCGQIYILPIREAERVLGDAFKSQFEKNPHRFFRRKVLDSEKWQYWKSHDIILVVGNDVIGDLPFTGALSQKDERALFGHYREDPLDKSHSHGEFPIPEDAGSPTTRVDTFLNKSTEHRKY